MGSSKSGCEALRLSLGCGCMKLTQCHKTKLLRTELQCGLPLSRHPNVHMVGGPDKHCKALEKMTNIGTTALGRQVRTCILNLTGFIAY